MTLARRIAFLATIGLGGLVVLLWLGFWQLDRAAWKASLIGELEAAMAAPPVALPASPTEAEDHFRPVAIDGRFIPEADQPQLRFLTSLKPHGPGHRLIAAFELADGRRIMVDRGYAPDAEARRGTPAPAAPEGVVRVEGVLRWPREVSSFTPAPNVTDRLVFARDVPAMAALLETEAVLVVARAGAADPSATWPRALPPAIDLPDDHMGYAVTWFALAAVWAAMSTALAFRGARRGRATAP